MYDLLKYKKNKNVMEKVFPISLISSLLILLILDIFYVPSDTNTEIIGYSLIFILLLLAVTLVILYGGLLSKTEQSKKMFKYGIIYAFILISEIGIIAFRMLEFYFGRLNL